MSNNSPISGSSFDWKTLSPPVFWASRSVRLRPPLSSDWYGGPSGALLLPIFNAGQIRAGVRLSEAQKREMVLACQKTVYNAFREVSDALASYNHTRRQRTQQELLVNAPTETTRLSTLRNRGGRDSYLQVLDAERNLFQGQLALAKLRLQEMLWFVQIYKALGGGWQ